MSINTVYLKRQYGLGLVELMIGLAIGLIVVGAAMTMLTTTLSSSNATIKMARLDQELRQAMTMVSRDLRRATLWDGAVDVSRVSLSDPLQLSAVTGNVEVTSSKGNLETIGAKAVGGKLVYYDGTTLHKGTISSYAAETYTVAITTAWPTSTIALDGVPQGSWSVLGPRPSITKTGNCILFAYDINANGVYTDGSSSTPNEFFGYRHINESTEQSIRIKTAWDGDCSPSTTGWTSLTDPDVVDVIAFTITDSSPGTVGAYEITPVTTPKTYHFNVGVREYTITITGRLKADTNVVRTLKETIRVRNDELGAGT